MGSRGVFTISAHNNGSGFLKGTWYLNNGDTAITSDINAKHQIEALSQ
jgi:hypothetical protein